MKPRLDSAVLTREDTKIWLNINLPLKRQAPNPFPSIAAFEADRRDAGLMLQIAMNRHLGTDCEDGDEQFSLAAWVLDMAVEE